MLKTPKKFSARAVPITTPYDISFPPSGPEPEPVANVLRGTPPCKTCGLVGGRNRRCDYCGEVFCGRHLAKHLAWEKRHNELAEEVSRFWREEKPGEREKRKIFPRKPTPKTTVRKRKTEPLPLRVKREPVRKFAT